MNKITIKKKTDNFTIIDNTGIRDEKLSWKAKGLLTYLLHLPDDWQVYLSDLKNRSTDGRDSTASAIKELVENGYIQRSQVKEKGKFSGYNYTVYEQPRRVIRNGSTETVLPNTENPTLLSTNNTKLLKKINTKKEETFDKLWSMYNKKVGKEKAYKAFKKVSKSDYDKIFEHVPKYVESTPDITFRKHLSTYLNQKSWEDEIIVKSEKKGFYESEEERNKEEMIKLIRNGGI